MTRTRMVLSNLQSTVEKTKDALQVISGAGAIAIITRLLLEYASRLHWVLGGALAVAFVVAAVWLTYQVKRASQDVDFRGILASLALGLLTFVVVCAWISFTMHTLGVGDYAVPTTSSSTTFFNFYMYTFLDLLPVIDAIETLHLKAPLETRDFIAGLPVFVFKVFVAGLFFDAFLSWYRSKHGAPTAPTHHDLTEKHPSQPAEAERPTP